MGKAAKKKGKAARFNPLARPANGPTPMDDDLPPAQEKPLSAHQQRHLERKRLQAEAQSLKKQKLKVSKSDKLAWKREKKSIQKSLKAVQAEAAALRATPLAAATAEPEDATGVGPLPGFAGFNLPAPPTTSAPKGWLLAGSTQ